MNPQLIIQGSLYFIIGALTPVGAVLASSNEMDHRAVAAMIVTGLVAGATALKAFFSTTFADSPESHTPGRMARLAAKSRK